MKVVYLGIIHLCPFMTRTTFALRPDSPFIALDKLLKLINLVGSGGEAHFVIQNGMVQVNGIIETQKRKKLVAGDKVTFQNTDVTIVSGEKAD